MFKVIGWCFIAALGVGRLAAQQPEASLPLRELAVFTDVMQKIKESYVEEVSDQTLLNNAIQGMLVRLDPHSSFLDSQALASLQEMTQGAFVGVGLEISADNNGDFKVITPIESGPAERAGIRTEDRLVKIGHKVLRGLSLKEVHDQLRGEAGTSVQLSIQRAGKKDLLEFSLKRELIQVGSLEARLLTPAIGYMKLRQFQEQSGQEISKQLELWQKQQPLSALILDLRNNPGGLVVAAVDVADIFLNSGVVVSTKGRSKAANASLSARSGDSLKGAPLVVLINGGSASASEIVAGALQDHQRALIVGTRSFGKGSVQTVLPVQGNSALKLTTALYYTPLGRSIQAEGIQPDVEVATLKLKAEAVETSSNKVAERDLPAVLANGNGRKLSELQVTANAMAETDFQLSEALNLVRAMILARR